MQTSFLALVLVALCATQAPAFLGLGAKHTTVTPVDGVVRLDAAQFDDGAARFYKLEHAGGDIKFFVLKSADGVIRAAFDACDVCWREGKGYEQDGETMLCVNCGLKFHSARINEVSGGCNPAPLTREVKDGRVIIKHAHILTGAGYFKGL